MRSADLSRHGFQTWSSFNRAAERALLSMLPKQPGVYAIRRHQEFTRMIGTSDIFYIGSAANQQGLKMQIRQSCHPGHRQTTNRGTRDIVCDSPDYELAFVVTKSGPEAKALEFELLEAYERDHGQLPPKNKRHAPASHRER